MNRFSMGCVLSALASLALMGCKELPRSDQPACIITVPLDETDAAYDHPRASADNSTQDCDGQMPGGDDRLEPGEASEANPTGEVALA